MTELCFVRSVRINLLLGHAVLSEGWRVFRYGLLDICRSAFWALLHISGLIFECKGCDGRLCPLVIEFGDFSLFLHVRRLCLVHFLSTGVVMSIYVRHSLEDF